MEKKVDDSICPLCQQSNRCDVNSQSGCWCLNTKVPAELLAKVPEHLRNKSCVCVRCIEKYSKTLS